MDKVSVVVINYNGYTYLKNLIPTIYKQSFPVEEIIIVDDCSTDNSADMIKGLYPDIRVESTINNAGPGAARNKGRKVAKNKKILFLDNDTELEPDALKRLILACKANSDYTFFIPRVLFFNDKNIIQKEGSGIHYLGFTVNGKNHGKHKNNAEDISREIKAFPGVCYLVNLESCKHIIEHDETFFYTMEDLDFSVANYLAENKALFIPEAEIYHKDGTGGLSYRKGYEYPSRRLFYFIRNRWFVIIKNYSFKSILLLLPLNIIIEILLFMFSLVRASDKLVYLKSHISLQKNFIKIYSKRKHPADISQFISNEKLQLNDATFGGFFMKSCFKIIDELLLLYGKFVLQLKRTG